MNLPFDSYIELDFFRQLWQKSYDPFWLCECVENDFVITSVNPAEEQIDSRLQPGKSIRSLIGYTPEADALLSGYFECRDTARTVRFRQEPQLNGQERLFETLLVPVTDAHGKVTHIYGTARDLTHFLTAQRAQEELNHQLEQRVAERTDELNKANDELRKANLVLERLASSDSLTELANRRCFFERVADEIARANRYGHPLALQMLDIDRFKRINDRFGHSAGDAVLRAVAGTLRANLRQNDFAARIGGEEFVILLPVTTIGDAVEHAERVRRAVEKSTVAVGDERLSVTVSIGVSGLDDEDLSEDPMLTRADRALYRSKKNGRNQIQAEYGPRSGGLLKLG